MIDLGKVVRSMNERFDLVEKSLDKALEELPKIA